ncbi:N-acetylmuramic acid 6-phosphate etherase [Mariluticola halotolerans]|uniref:N-acetylmuramic acid 6-phosphate etherase n=1 Tax=Mariluticola halotolerans TaxID=2909283 RepID=UPI0026E48619|nr:N-acetylmuramic acid 6-phosphate etherase [Mariluticola halotolerans]UJQ95544.1 N-acetylmuramic acid 6-phosphate etherase [Mariluticola halotolerans]
MPQDVTSRTETETQSGEWRETEFRSPRYENLETWGAGEVLSALLGGQHQALHAVWGALPQIEKAVAAAVARLARSNGRLVYVGAGTSGRLGTLDGVELTPTFGWPKERIVYLFAGGDAGLRRAQEGAEDDAAAAEASIAEIAAGPDDVVIGLAASGTTPYTRAAITAARKNGALTISLANNPGSPLLDDAEIGILLRSGAEVLAGSTRLAAGTSQKVTLNLFSTTLMIGLNKVYRGYMVDMQTSNEKLVLRAERMVMKITKCDLDTARTALATAENHIKLAVLLVNGVEKSAAQLLLAQHDGNLGAALDAVTS